MVGGPRGLVRLEIVPWLTEPFGHGGTSRLVLEEELEAPTSLGDFLASLATKHPAIATAVLDLQAGRLFEHVSVVRNGVALAPHVAVTEIVKDGDRLVLLPAFSGGQGGDASRD